MIQRGRGGQLELATDRGETWQPVVLRRLAEEELELIRAYHDLLCTLRKRSIQSLFDRDERYQ